MAAISRVRAKAKATRLVSQVIQRRPHCSETKAVVPADEGCGTEAPERVLETAKGFGLRSIRERTLQLGGAFRVHRKPGSGWVVSLDIPLEPVGAGEPA